MACWRGNPMSLGRGFESWCSKPIGLGWRLMLWLQVQSQLGYTQRAKTERIFHFKLSTPPRKPKTFSISLIAYSCYDINHLVVKLLVTHWVFQQKIMILPPNFDITKCMILATKIMILKTKILPINFDITKFIILPNFRYYQQKLWYYQEILILPNLW